MARHHAAPDEELGEINVVPLVDVMLVLLTIVLTTATFVVNGRIPVDLARASQAAPAQASPVVVTLTADRQLYLNDQPVQALHLALQPYAKAQPVVVRADAAVALGPFVEVVDRIKALGFVQVSLEVRRS